MSRPNILLSLLVLFLSAFRLSCQVPPPTITEFPEPGQSFGITRGPDGALWFTLPNSPGVGRITTTGVVTVYPSSTPSCTADPFFGPTVITTGSDGALWFTNNGVGTPLGGCLGRITTTGVASGYRFASSGSGYLQGITTGPDNALWFTQCQGNQIWRATISGTLSSYSSIGDCPIAITTGPDGALWFGVTSNGTSRGVFVGRITTAGVVTTPYAVLNHGNGSVYITSITTGPDGALWFTLLNNVGRITTKGEVKLYPVPSTALQGITTGPDGALWFTGCQVDCSAIPSNGTGVIGRITTGGALSLYPVPTANSFPLGITTGPDGALWFTEALASNIGRIVLSTNPPGLNRAQQTAPIQLGSGGSNVKALSKVCIPLVECYCCEGTLGSLVQDTLGKTYILGNNHVLARSNEAQIGEQIIQTGYLDTATPCSSTGTIAVAQLSTFVTIQFGGVSNYFDAAIAQILPGQVNSTGDILEVGTVSSASVSPSVGMSVMKSGRTTGETSGSIDKINVTVNVGGYGPCGCGQPLQPACKTAKFVKQFTVIPNDGFTGDGDSGALVVKRVKTGNPNPVGLLLGETAAGSAIVTPINTVLSGLGVTVVGSTPTAQDLANSLTPPDPQMERASEIKDRNDDFLLSLPECVGHGVGYSRNGSGKVVIQVFLRKATKAARRAVPSSLEGIPVEVLETGDVHIIPACHGIENEGK